MQIAEYFFIEGYVNKYSLSKYIVYSVSDLKVIFFIFEFKKSYKETMSPSWNWIDKDDKRHLERAKRTQIIGITLFFLVGWNLLIG